MIKIAIVDADTRMAGELIRILIFHPDADIVGAVSRRYAGQRLAAVHHGLEGEPPARFTADLPQKADVVIYCGDTAPDAAIRQKARDGDVRIIDAAAAERADTAAGSIPAVSEIYRKPMVRGARESRVLGAPESGLLPALYPLARHLLLHGDITVDVAAAGELKKEFDLERSSATASVLIGAIQQSFEGNITMTLGDTLPGSRSMRLRARVPVSMHADDIAPLYESLYDDHNFVYVTNRAVGTEEVEGTEKCLIRLTTPEKGELLIEVLADGRMRGGAGDAVLAMNLMFGLHERTGLNLKASTY